MKALFLCAIFILSCTRFALCAEKEVNVLGEGFVPDNIKSIYKEVSSQKEPAKRGEFESLEVYKKRIADWEQTISSKPYVIAMPKSPVYNWHFYNPDTKSFNFFISLNDNFIADISSECAKETNKYLSIKLFDEREDKGVYIGENAFGVKKEITKTKHTAYFAKLLLPSSVSKFIKSKGSFNKYFEIPYKKLDPSEAKSLKDNYEIFFIVVPTPLACKKTATNYSYHISTPTINSPSEYTFDSYTTFFTLKEVIIVNAKDKTALMRLK